MRDDFSEKTKDSLRKRAGYICSNPDCRKLTIAPSLFNEHTFQFLGVCAHITAARKNGPRFDKSYTEQDRKGIKNAIFLCSNCAAMIDKNNGDDYPAQVLLNWKQIHENWIQDNLNKKILKEVTLNTNFNKIINNTINLNQGQPNINNIDRLSKNRISHDIEILKKINKTISEKKLMQILSILEGNESIKINEIHLLSRLSDILSQTSNSFIKQKLEKLEMQFYKQLEKLNTFIHDNFDAYPYNQNTINFQVCLSPRTNCDRAGNLNIVNTRKHSQLHAEMVSIIYKIKKSYTAFILESKHKLIV